jgi:hypothetical protein
LYTGYKSFITPAEQIPGDQKHYFDWEALGCQAVRIYVLCINTTKVEKEMYMILQDG